MAEVVISPSYNNAGYQGAPTFSGFETGPDLIAGWLDANTKEYRSWLVFDLTGVDVTKVASGILSVYKYANGGSDPSETKVSRIIRPDVGSGSSWNNFKAGSPWGAAGCSDTVNDYLVTDEVSSPVPGNFTFQTWDVTDQVSSATDDFYTLRLATVDAYSAGARAIYRSSNYATVSERPILTLTIPSYIPSIMQHQYIPPFLGV